MPGAGAIYHHATGTFGSTLEDGDAAGLTAAKAACAAGGLIQMGPGTEGITLGAGWGTIALARIDALGRMFGSRWHITDGDDPTKVQAWDVSAISTGTTRTVVAPNYGGLLLLPATLGTAGQFLQSAGAGTQPVWAAVTGVGVNALLDGVNHTDTLIGTVLRGDLIVGNSTPKWARLALGTSGQVLTSNGTDAAWSSNPAVQHDTLAHLAPITVTLCSLLNGSDDITHGSSGLAAVKVGDFVEFGANVNATIQGARVITAGAGSIQIDLTYVGADITNQTMHFYPGDHWNNTLALQTGTGAGLFLTLGRGTYNPTNSSGSFQEIRGPVRWRGHNDGNLVTDFRVEASGSTSTLSGFSIFEKGATPSGAYFYAAALTADRVYSFPNISGEFTLAGNTQTLTGKTLDTSNKIAMDGTNTRTIFTNGGGGERLVFDFDNAPAVTALRNVEWPDYDGRVPVEGAAATFADADTSPTVKGSRLFKASNTGATVITTFDDAVPGQHVTIIFTNSNTTIDAGANMKLAAGLDFVGTADDTLQLVYDGTSFFEVSRSVNA